MFTAGENTYMRSDLPFDGGNPGRKVLVLVAGLDTHPNGTMSNKLAGVVTSAKCRT